MVVQFWHGLHKYEVTISRSRPLKIRVHTDGKRWRTIWRFPEPRSDLVSTILARHSLKVGNAMAREVFTEEKYPLHPRIAAARNS